MITSENILYRIDRGGAAYARVSPGSAKQLLDRNQWSGFWVP